MLVLHRVIYSKLFSAVLGQSATNTEPVFLRPTDRTKSLAGSLVSEGSCGSGTAFSLG